MAEDREYEVQPHQIPGWTAQWIDPDHRELDGEPLPEDFYDEKPEDKKDKK